MKTTSNHLTITDIAVRVFIVIILTVAFLGGLTAYLEHI